jgi:nitrogen-specific signal transduction histidine kinase/ActR/RegA family two-component response regulator
LTEQKKVEAEKEKLADQLRQSRKMQAIGQLAGGVAHDFNNLLAGILGCTEIVLSEENLSPQGIQHLKNIIKTTEKGQDLTRNLMSFARLKDKISVESNLNEIITHVISILEHTVDRTITLTTSLEAESVIIMGDPTDIENSILNIALNARDAMPNGGIINFGTDNITLNQKFCTGKDKLSPGDYLLLKISDTGNGIPDHIKDKIFDPFFTTKPEGEGTGLGLSSVFGCIQSHNGYIAVDSVWHQGTTFNIYLPLSESSGDETSPKPTTPEVKTGQGHIMLVEDEEIVRDVTSIAIRKLGYHVTAFENGFDAIDFYRDHASNIDLAILDMVMPKINGLALFKKLKAINKDLKAIIMSGYTGHHTPEQALEAGVITLLQKPVKASRLSQVLAEILTQKEGDKNG